MTAQRQHRYTAGHVAYKVFWQRIGNTESERIGWTPENQNPTCKLAVWWSKLACALEEGKDRYFYADSTTTPEPRNSRNEPSHNK